MAIATPQQMAPGNQLFVGLTYDRRSVVSQHIGFWQKNSNVSPDKYVIMKLQHEFGDTREVLFFTDKVALEQFVEWWAKYEARFPKDQIYEHPMPMPQEGQLMTGYPLMHKVKGRDSMTMNQLQKAYIDQWFWIAEHTSDPVLFTKEFWLFSNEAEMIMFKLRDKQLNDDTDDEKKSYDFF